MSRSIRVAVSQEFLERAKHLLRPFHAKKSGIELTFVGVPEPDKVNTERLSELFSGAEIGFINPTLFPLLSKCIPSCTKWIQCTWAGLDNVRHLSVEQKKKLQGCIITRAGGVFARQMSEYVLCAVISMERNLSRIYERQLKNEWKRQDDVLRYRTLSQLSIGILGLGDIGKDVAEVRSGLGMTVYGLKRTPHECKNVKKVFGTEELPVFLSMCDYVCSILPNTEETTRLLSGETLKHCAKKSPGFINIGRGNVIDEESIVRALEKGWISKAFLDVFSTEPLDASSPLWSMKNVTITPHVSGTSNDTVVDMFYDNLERYVNGDELKYVYNWKKGY